MKRLTPQMIEQIEIMLHHAEAVADAGSVSVFEYNVRDRRSGAIQRFIMVAGMERGRDFLHAVAVAPFALDPRSLADKDGNPL